MELQMQHLAGMSHSFQTILTAILVAGALTFVPKLLYRLRLARLPSLDYGEGKKKRDIYLRSATQLYSDGYQQFKDKVFRIATSEGKDNIVIPLQLLPELRQLPDSVLSFPESVKETLYTNYLGLEVGDSVGPHVVKADLTPALVRLNPIIASEIEEAMREEMPNCDDWTEVNIYMKIVRIVARASGRLFVGPELCRNEQYLDAGIYYTMELIRAHKRIQEMNPWLRPILAPRLPEVQKLRQREREGTTLLLPIVQARREAEKNPDYEKPNDMLQWIMNKAPHMSVERIAKIQLNFIFAAIHTTSSTGTNTMYKLAVTPDYIDPLREEICTVLANNDGSLTFRALQELEKVDSYMKECLRYYPMAVSSFTRKVLQGFTLSNGQYIPAGVNIEAPTYSIYHDSDFYPDGEKFDGFRFSKLRELGGAGVHARNQFVTTNEQNLHFGYGRHACPGRFFASNELKMILVHFLQKYDFKNADGSKELYPHLKSARSLIPDPSKTLLFKKVTV